MHSLEWVKVAEPDALQDGQIASVTVRGVDLCLVHARGQWAALDNVCPHQGGPLGDGTLDCDDAGDCEVQCPWHGWSYNALTGEPPGEHAEEALQTYPVEIRDDGVYVGLAAEVTVEQPRTVSDTVVETLVNWGVRRVFGMVGHSNLGLADAVRRRVDAGDMAFVGIRHEGAAAFAASAYGKLTGTPAACLTIAGPGATNLLTGLWDAKVDRAPVLALTGQVQTQVLGPGVFQDIDLASAFAAVSRFSRTVLTDSNHAELASLACKSALVEQDVAHLVFPDDVQTVPSDLAATGPTGRLVRDLVQPADEAVRDALAMIKESQRPAIVAGHGCMETRAEVIALAEALGAPILTTFKAKGFIPDGHPNAAGVLGRSGTPVASAMMTGADLLICLGASFAVHTGIAESKPTIQVDLDRMQLGKFHPVTLPVWGDIGRFCGLVAASLGDRSAASDQLGELAARWADWRAEKQRRAAANDGNGLNSATVFAALTRTAPADAIIAVDVGNNTYSFGRYFEVADQHVLMSGYLGSIGFGLPAALGAWAATQDHDRFGGRKVISVSGDGGFGQYAMEFTTAVKYDMDITHVLLNNDELGKITKEQRSGQWEVWETGLRNPGFAEFARLCGGHGVRVTESGELAAALAAAVAHEGPALVEIMTDAELI